MELEKQNESLRVLKGLDALFKMFNITYWLDAGTLLCAFRDGNLNNEHDIDVGIFGEDYRKVVTLNPVIESMLNCKTLEYLAFLYDVIFAPPEISNETHLMDIMAWYKLDDKIRSCLGAKLPITMPLRFFEKFEEVSLGGHRFPTPCKIGEYLERYFGEGWETPISNEEYTEFQDRCVGSNERPEVHMPYPNHLELWRKAIKHLDIEYFQDGKSMNEPIFNLR